MKKRYVIAILSMTGIVGTLNASMAEQPYSTNLYGALGLNTIPSARMDETGTIRAQISHLDPYVHTVLGMQLAEPLYLALSKRYKDFDFTGGIGWGRFATAAHIDNPLKSLSNHFGKDRDINGENPNKPQNWLTGEDIGFFAGVEYFTPLKGLSLKADFGGDRYEAEKAAFNFRPAAPWSVGLNYKPPIFSEFADIGIAAQGTDKIMARLSLQGNIRDWNHRSANNKTSTPLAPYRTDTTAPGAMQSSAKKDKISLSYLSAGQNTAEAILKYSPHHSSPSQFGKAAIHMANHAGQSIEEIKISPTSYGLRGPSIHLMRRSLESALAHNNGSTDEIGIPVNSNTTSMASKNSVHISTMI